MTPSPPPAAAPPHDYYNWNDIRLFNDAIKGLEAIERLTGEAPTVILKDPALEKWRQVGRMTADFYKLDLQERLYVSGLATRERDERA